LRARSWLILWVFFGFLCSATNKVDEHVFPEIFRLFFRPAYLASR
jgi:hypothetical protein